LNDDTILRPLGNRVMIEPDEPTTSSRGGILIPDTAQKRPQRGTVVALGDLVDEALGLRAGSVVQYSKYGGAILKLSNGQEVVFVEPSDIICEEIAVSGFVDTNVEAVHA